MSKYRCSHCNKYFNTAIKYTKNKYNTQYYLCSGCNTKRVKKYRETEKGRQASRRASIKSTKKYQYKQDARVKVNSALISGKLIKPNICENCKEIKIVEGHHFDYGKPLEVVWLCKKCHCDLHR